MKSNSNSLANDTSQNSKAPQLRLTVRLPAELHCRAKATAALQGETLAALVERALRRELQEAL